MYAMLQEIDHILSKVNANLNDVEQNAERTKESLRKVEGVALRYLAIARSFGLPENIEQAIGVITSLIVAVRMAQMAISTLQVSMGPIGWASFIASGTLTAISFGSIGYDLMRGT